MHASDWLVSGKILNKYTAKKHEMCQTKELSFAPFSNFLISVSLQPDAVNLWYFKLSFFDLTELIDKGIRKSEFVAKAQFVW